MSTTVERAELVTAAAFPASADVQAIIRLALAEDVGRGDVTSEATVSPDAVARADILQKAPGVVCGLPVVAEVWRELDPRVRVTPVVAEGSFDDRRRVVARLDGPASAILTGERTALNFLQRLSGVASVSRRAMQLVVGSHATVIDTRKTTPGMRVLEKYAVRVGGASNHRAGLDDGMLIKENHIRAAGGISPAVRAAQRRAAPGMLVEVEDGKPLVSASPSPSQSAEVFLDQPVKRSQDYQLTHDYLVPALRQWLTRRGGPGKETAAPAEPAPRRELHEAVTAVRS